MACKAIQKKDFTSSSKIKGGKGTKMSTYILSLCVINHYMESRRNDFSYVVFQNYFLRQIAFVK